jgi:triosephosphate isomerase
LLGGLRDVSEEDIDTVIIAYEQVWAISSTKAAKYAAPYEVADAIKLIRSTIAELYDKKVAEELPVLFGGSVNPSNAGGYLTVPGVNGLLMGGSSLILSEFVDIIDIAKRVKS